MLIHPKTNLFFPIKEPLPPILKPWLTHKDSLTELLQLRAGNTRLQVVGQRWEPPNWWDKNVLNIENEDVFHREILMWAGQEVCWYARTIIPKTTHQSGVLVFNRLQEVSLGALIFTEPTIKRVYMTYYPINDQSIEFYWLDPLMRASASILWVRMSIFTINNDFPFVLIEALLPPLERYFE